MEELSGKKHRQGKMIVRVLKRILFFVAVLLVIVLGALGLPVVQTYIAQRIVSSIQAQTGASVSVGRLKISLLGNIHLGELMVRDLKSDTLFYAQNIKISFDWLRLMDNELFISRFEVDNVAANVLRNSNSEPFNYQFLVDFFVPHDAPVDTTASEPWRITVKNTNLTNIRASYYDGPGELEANIALGQLAVKAVLVDLANITVQVDDLKLANTKGNFGLLGGAMKETSVGKGESNLIDAEPPTMDSSFFSSWTITANFVQLENIGFVYDNTVSAPVDLGIDYNHLGIERFSAKILSATVSPKEYAIDIDSLSLSEKSGWVVDELSAKAAMSNSTAQVTNFNFVSPHSSIKADVALTFGSIDKLTSDLWNSVITANVQPSRVGAEDVLAFAPQLAGYDWFANLLRENIQIKAALNGPLNDLSVDSLWLHGMSCTTLASSFHIKGLPSVDDLRYKGIVSDLTTCLGDVERLGGEELGNDMKWPKTITLASTVEGTAKNCRIDGTLTSSLGKLSALGFYQWDSPSGRDSLFAKVESTNFRLDALLNDTTFGKVNLSGWVNGSGFANADVFAKSSVDIVGLDYAGYTYNQIQVQGSAEGSNISAIVTGVDPNLSFTLDAQMVIVDSTYEALGELELVNANLKALGYANENVSISTHLFADAKFRAIDSFNVALRAAKLKLVTDSVTIPFDSIVVHAKALPDYFGINLKSPLLDIAFDGNVAANELGSVLENAYQTYAGKNDSTTVFVNKNVSVSVDVHLPKEVMRLISPDFERLEINRFDGSYNSDSNVLKLKVDVPAMEYAGLRFDTLTVLLNGERDRLSMDLKLNKLVYDTLSISNISIEEVLKKGVLHSTIAIDDSASLPRYYFANEISLSPNGYNIRFKPDGLVLDGQAWLVNDSNDVMLGKELFVANGLEFRNKDQVIGLFTNDEDFSLQFTDFRIENLTDMVKQPNGRSLVKGRLNGTLAIPFKSANVEAHLSVDDLYALDNMVGRLLVKLKTMGDTMDVVARYENLPNTIDVSGNITHLNTLPLFDLQLLLDMKDLSRLEQLSFGEVSGLGGIVNGDIKLTGTTNNYLLNGFVGFNSTAFKLNSLNFEATINDEKIVIDPSGFHFDNFSIEDKSHKELLLDGSVLSKDFVNYDFDLHLTTKNFQPINSTISDNPLFFGSLLMDADVLLKGSLENPNIKADLKINKATDLTYRMPGSELQLVSSEGTVVFIDPSKANDPISNDLYDDILNDSIMMKLKGLNLSLDLAIEDGANFRVDIDPTSGDYLSFSGRSALNLTSDITGKQTVTGIYEVSEGIYQLSFYGMVKKSFGIVPGSTISWSGQPMDADLNINAAYEVRASSSALLSQETSSMTEGERNAYKQPLPYTVKLKINGFLAQPEISFNLELPDKYLVAYPLLANKLNMLNTPEMASELNKQVFSLLVAGSFIPSSPMASSTSTTSTLVTTAARNSVNGLLASQLNNMSAKYIQGFDLDFGLTSYEDYTEGTGGTRTELDVQVSKKLMNDRLEVEAIGSFNIDSDKNKTASSTTQQNTGEFAVSYLLTEDGVYKLRAYYQNAYDTFDGEYGYSGIALIFEREFDRSDKQLRRNAERVVRFQQRKASKNEQKRKKK